MEIETKSQTGERADALSSINGASPRKKFVRQGFIKRFLKWIARGTDKSGIRQGSCPT